MISDYIAYWPLDELSGNVFDLSVNGYTGTNNGTTSVDGRLVRARQFVSASNQYITMGNVLDFTNNNFTISLWYKSTSGTSGYLINKGSGSTGQYTVYFNGNGRITLYVQTDGSNWSQVTDGNPLHDTADGQWHHFVGIRSGASLPNLFLYIDGIDRVSIGGTTTQSSGVVTSLTNIADFTLSSLTSLYNGSLDEVKIYNRALTGTEANQLFTAGYNNKFNNSGIRPRPFAPGLAR